MKSATRRFLYCFRPVESESGDLGGENDVVYKSGQVKNKDEEEEEGLGCPPKRSSRRFSKTLKSALFENSLGRSFRSGSSRISVVATEKALNQSETNGPNSPLSSSGPLSLPLENPAGATLGQPPAAQVNHDESLTSKSCINSGLGMLLLSLVLTVFRGQLFAIAFTLIFLCSFSRRRSRLLPQEAGAEANRHETAESWDYKKRVIMEGLLQRSHHHRRPN